MKKVISLVMALMLTTCICTVNAQAAPTPHYEGDGYYTYGFYPDNIFAPNDCVWCGDYARSTSGFWKVPAGNTFLFYLNAAMFGTFKATVFKRNAGSVFEGYYDESITIELPPIESDAEYIVRIINVSSKESYLGGYGFLNYN